MANYYCDLAADYTDGAGTSGDPYDGAGGLIQAIRGTGGATPLNAGDTIYCKGTALVGRLALFTGLGDDVGAGGWNWALGAVVRDNGGGGVVWQGVVCEIDVEASGTSLLVQMDSGYTHGDVVDAQGIDNTDDDEQTTITATVGQPIELNNYGGTAGGGRIHFIGTDASWVDQGGTTRARLDAQSTIANVILNSVHYMHFKNFEIANSISNGVEGASAKKFWWFENFVAENCGGDGINGDDFSSSFYESCLLTGNTLRGCDDAIQSVFWKTLVVGNGSGIEINRRCLILESGIIDNGSFGVSVWSGVCFIVNSVIDNNNGPGVDFNAIEEICFVVGSRITHNDGYGLSHDSGMALGFENWNTFWGNVSGSLNNIDEGAYSHSDSGGGEHGARADITSNEYTTRTHTITYENGIGDMRLVSENDAITTSSGWAGTVLTVPDGEFAGTFEANVTSGFPDDGDGMTFDGNETADADGIPAIQWTGDNASNYTTLASAAVWNEEDGVPVA